MIQIDDVRRQRDQLKRQLEVLTDSWTEMGFVPYAIVCALRNEADDMDMVKWHTDWMKDEPYTEATDSNAASGGE